MRFKRENYIRNKIKSTNGTKKIEKRWVCNRTTKIDGLSRIMRANNCKTKRYSKFRITKTKARLKTKIEI